MRLDLIASELSSAAVTAVPDMENQDGTEKRNSSHLGDAKETPQQVTDGSAVSEPVPESQLDVSLPLNWPTRKKFLNMAVPSFICFVV
jgi:hypothetical protein